MTDRSSIADESKLQEYYEQVQILEKHEELETARRFAYYALFAQMQKMDKENQKTVIELPPIGQPRV